MKKVASLYNLSEDEWRKLREKGIGGSDVGVLLGYSKYKTNVELWEEKAGIKVPVYKDSPATLRGKKAEEHILRLWEAFNMDNVRIIKPEYMYCHDKYDFLRANFDGFAVVNGERCVIEIKTAEPRNFKEWDKKIPYPYYCQCLHYMLISGLSKAYLVAAIKPRGKDDIAIKTYPIQRNEFEIQWLLQEELEFWEMVKSKTKPKLKIQLDL